MPNTTSKFALRSPLATEAPLGHTQMQNLSQDVEGMYAPSSIAIRNPSPASGIGAGVYNTELWYVESGYPIGVSGVFSYNQPTGQLTCTKAGLYMVKANLTMSGAGARMEAKVVLASGTKTVMRDVSPTDDNILSMAWDGQLPAGSVLTLQILNFGTASAGLPADDATNPNRWSVVCWSSV